MEIKKKQSLKRGEFAIFVTPRGDEFIAHKPMEKGKPIRLFFSSSKKPEVIYEVESNPIYVSAVIHHGIIYRPASVGAGSFL